MKKLVFNRISLNNSNRLSVDEKKNVLGGMPRIQCWCEGSSPIWYASCECPNAGCIVMSDVDYDCAG